MSTRLLDYKQLHDLQPAYGLWQLYAPENAPYRFWPESLAEAKEWQQHTRQALVQTLGLRLLPDAPLSSEKIEEVDKGDYLREKIVIRTSTYSLMPVYMLIPKQGNKPFPVVMALHGHGYGVKDIVGLWEDGEERNTPNGYHKDFLR